MKFVLLILFVSTSYAEVEFLPDPILTPGKINPALTEEVIRSKGFTTKDYREVSEAVKHEVFKRYKITFVEHAQGEYEIDHLISLTLGGANDIENLWPEPYFGKINAQIKDRLESWLGRQVKTSKMSLKDAQNAIRTNWINSYNYFFQTNLWLLTND